ncbi:MAG: LPS assembly lipoprotein LptE [Bacteroidota bacterium]|nr:LPS assembly lipoprotein LptE [Bacteroidota bacterium]
MLRLLAIPVLIIFILQGCCYTFSPGNPGNAQTFSVAFFENRASLVNPNLSQFFTEGLKDKFLRQTSLKLITEGEADMQLSGTITGYDVTPASIQSNDQAQLNRLTMTVQIKFVNSVDEEKSFEQTFSNFADFPATETLSQVETQLVQAIVEKLAQDIFNRAVINW